MDFHLGVHFLMSFAKTPTYYTYASGDRMTQAQQAAAEAAAQTVAHAVAQAEVQAAAQTAAPPKNNS